MLKLDIFRGDTPMNMLRKFFEGFKTVKTVARKRDEHGEVQFTLYFWPQGLARPLLTWWRRN